MASDVKYCGYAKDERYTIVNYNHKAMMKIFESSPEKSKMVDFNTDLAKNAAEQVEVVSEDDEDFNLALQLR